MVLLDYETPELLYLKLMISKKGMIQNLTTVLSHFPIATELGSLLF